METHFERSRCTVSAGRGGVARRFAPLLAGNAGRRLALWIWRHSPRAIRRAAVRLLVPRRTVGACAVIRDSAGRVLLAHHTYREQPWSLPGGFVRRNEDPARAVIREVREELRVSGTVERLLGVESDADSGNLTLYYQVSLAGTPACDGVELDGVRFAGEREVALLFGETPVWLHSQSTVSAA